MILLHAQSLNKFNYNGFALEHVVFSGNEKDDIISEAEARRILLELMIKDCLVKYRVPVSMTELARDWKLFCYRLSDGGVLGASMTITNDGEMERWMFVISDSQE